MCGSYIPYLLSQRKEMRLIWEQADSLPPAFQEGKCPTICAGRNLSSQSRDLSCVPTTGTGCRWGVLSPSVGPDLGSLWPFPSLCAWKLYPPASSRLSVVHYHLFTKFSIKLFSAFSYAVLCSGEEKRKTLTMTIKPDFQKLFQQTLLWPLHWCG